MDKFLEIVGIVIVVATIALGFLILSNTGARPGDVALGLVTWCIPGIIGGLVLTAFGQMLGQLKAIRYQAEKQNWNLEQIVAKQPPPRA